MVDFESYQNAQGYREGAEKSRSEAEQLKVAASVLQMIESRYWSVDSPWSDDPPENIGKAVADLLISDEERAAILERYGDLLPNGEGAARLAMEEIAYDRLKQAGQFVVHLTESRQRMADESEAIADEQQTYATIPPPRASEAA